MIELINREAALDAIKFAELGCEYDEVEKVPSVDAVPVVRCGDCKWLFNDSNTFFKPCEVIIPEKDWYCAYGEREVQE